MENIKFLRGKRVYFRPLEKEDLPSLHRWLNDPEIRRIYGEVFPRSLAEEKEWLEKMYDDRSKIWFALALNETDTIIGDGGFLRIDYMWRTADLSILIGKKSEWSKGYGTEAVRLLVEFGFQKLNLHRIGIGVFPFNTRAIRTYEKVGFKREGVLRDGYYCDNTYHDVILMSIMEEEFRGKDISI
jgi:RimJ/RimL family protein N-acetyltransferase